MTMTEESPNIKKGKEIIPDKETAIKENKKLAKIRKEKKWYCWRCGAMIPSNINRKTDRDGNVKGRCPSCKRTAIFVDYRPIPENIKKREEEQARQLKKDTEEGIAEEQKKIDYLHDPKFIIYIVEEIQKEVAGEEDTIIAEIMVATTRLVSGAMPESKNLFLSDVTGIGKDWVTKKTLEVLIPKEDHYHVTKMTKEAFTYWHIGEPWDKKVIHFEDITQELLNSSTFKVMSSGGSYAVVVKDQKTIEIPINGKPCMILTSHHANPQSEALRRFPIGALNDTLDQTKRIKDKISKKYTGRTKKNIDHVIRSAVQSLKPYSVVIPYAEVIQHFFPEDILMRTHYHRFLDYICASAIFHQYQREKTEDDKLIATPDDYMIARISLIYTTSNPKMIPMSKEYRDLIKLLQENVESMTVNEIYVKYDKSKDWLYKNLPNLIATKLVIAEKQYKEDAQKEIIAYQYAPSENPYSIPTKNEIDNKMDDIINKTLKTNNTPPISLQEMGFYCDKIKPLKRGFYWFYLGKITPSQQSKEGGVLRVLSNYLRKRDEKRYQKYFKEPDPPLKDELQIIKNSIEKNRKAKYEITLNWLYDNFKPNIIDQCIQSGLLTKLPNNEYEWR